MSDGLKEAAMAVQQQWTDAFRARDFDRLVALYAADTQFLGSTQAFHTTPEGVREYFRVLPSYFVDCDYAIPNVIALGEDALTATGDVIFYTTENGPGTRTERPFRMTHVLVRQAGQWKIATHHASPRPPT